MGWNGSCFIQPLLSAVIMSDGRMFVTGAEAEPDLHIVTLTLNEVEKSPSSFHSSKLVDTGLLVFGGEFEKLLGQQETACRCGS